jgi:hypothetical protein
VTVRNGQPEPQESGLPSTSLDGEQDWKTGVKKHPTIWNPFQRLETEADALQAAKVGAVVAGIIAIEHVAFGLIVGTVLGTIGNLIAIVLMAVLGWYILKKQKVWASITVLVWVMVEIIAKIGFVLGPHASHAPLGSLIIDIIALAGALLSLRGCLKLRKLGHAEQPTA